MRGSLYEMEIENARKGAIEHHKHKLNTRKSLSKGGQLYAFQGVHQMGVKRRKEADDKLRKAKKALQVEENKLKAVFEERGIKGRKDDLIRKKAILQLQATNQLVPESMLIPIRDCRKEPWPEELESLRANQSFYDTLAGAQNEWEISRRENPERELIDPSILEFEEQFAVRRGGLQNVIVDVDDKEGDEVIGGIESPTRSVVSLESIAQNADFVELEY